MTLKTHCLDDDKPRTLCGVPLVKPHHVTIPSEWDVATGRISRGCIAVPAAAFEPYPDRSCVRCIERWSRL